MKGSVVQPILNDSRDHPLAELTDSPGATILQLFPFVSHVLLQQKPWLISSYLKKLESLASDPSRQRNLESVTLLPFELVRTRAGSKKYRIQRLMAFPLVWYPYFL